MMKNEGNWYIDPEYEGKSVMVAFTIYGQQHPGQPSDFVTYPGYLKKIHDTSITLCVSSKGGPKDLIIPKHLIQFIGMDSEVIPPGMGNVSDSGIILQ
jgi:hypothetical protein